MGNTRLTNLTGGVKNNLSNNLTLLPFDLTILVLHRPGKLEPAVFMIIDWGCAVTEQGTLTY